MGVCSCRRRGVTADTHEGDYVKNNRICIRIRDDDRMRLELIRDTMGVSMSGAIRASIVAMCRQLGFEKEFSPDFMKKK